MATRMVIGAVVVGLLSLLLSYPVPEGWQQPWKTKFFLASYALNVNLGYAADALGFNGIQLRRNIMDAGVSIMSKSGVADVETTDTLIEGVRVRIYTPLGHKEGKLPAVIYYHGGGWATGSIVTHDNIVKRMVKDIGVYGISVEYRLAPEHKYPVPLEDCVKVTKHVLSHAEQFSIDGSRVALAGDSAGGNFAAAISLLLRDEKFPVMPKLQVLIYPSLQLFDFATPSYQANKDGPLITTKHVGEFKGLHLQGHTRNANDYITNRHVTKAVVDEIRRKYLPLDRLPNDRIKQDYVPVESPVESALWEEIRHAVLSPYASPLIAETLEGAPFAYILACQHDVLRDDAIWFAERMRGNARLRVLNCFHGCMNFSEDLESVAEIMKKMNDFIREYL